MAVHAFNYCYSASNLLVALWLRGANVIILKCIMIFCKRILTKEEGQEDRTMYRWAFTIPQAIMFLTKCLR